MISQWLQQAKDTDTATGYRIHRQDTGYIAGYGIHRQDTEYLHQNGIHPPSAKSQDFLENVRILRNTNSLVYIYICYYSITQLYDSLIEL